MNEGQPSVLDQATFQRVWQRVMPEDRLDCPFTVDPPAVPAVQPVPFPNIPPAQPSVCLGETSTGELPTLERLLSLTADSYRIYRAMGRRAGQKSLLSALTAAKRQQAKRLSTAYFLISGREYAAPPTPAPQSSTLALALRARFQAEQQVAAAFSAAANATGDLCLGELYRTLAAENQTHARRLREWLEQN